MLVDGLSTQVNNEISFKDADLEEDEYITEYQFRFGTVKVGFSEVEAPISILRYARQFRKWI